MHFLSLINLLDDSKMLFLKIRRVELMMKTDVTCAWKFIFVLYLDKSGFYHFFKWVASQAFYIIW